MRNFGSCHDHKSTFNKISLNAFLAKAKHSNVTVRGILSLLLFFFSLCSEASTLDIHLSVHFMDIQEARLLALIEGVLAANIFDWGSRACVDLYHKGTIIEIYRMSRKKMQRPWRASIPSLNFLNVTVALRPLRVIKKKSCAVTNYIINFMYFFLQIDDFDMFKKRMLTDRKDQPYKRALLFVDNSGADVVLGMLPLARELLRHGTEV